jgi:hypothetical protein
MRLLATLLLAMLLLAAPASARVKPGLYKGKTAEGSTVKLTVIGSSVLARTKVRITCTFRSGDDPSAAPQVSRSTQFVETTDDDDRPAKLAGARFDYRHDTESAGGGDPPSTEAMSGRFSGSRISGKVAFDSDGSNPASGSRTTCTGKTTFTARRVPGS